MDADFGPFFVKFSTYFPFTAKLCINGNEWAKRQAAKAGIEFEALDNGFAAVDDVQKLQAICDSLGPEQIDALLRKWLRILPTTDLSANFLMLAGPFLLIGEVERKLRQVVSISFTLDEISAGKDERDAGRVVSSVNDLTLGETIRLFQPREGWDKLGWQVDRAVFCSALEASVALRNDIMHFSPDPIEEERLKQVRYLLKWLNLLV